VRSRLATLVLLLSPTAALAGMPSVHLTEVATMRFSAISFFIGIFLGVAVAVRFLWNRLRRDFTRMPPLSFGAALALVFLFGLGIQLVLSMIAGGRELMTPGAWEKTGVTYRLADAPPTESQLLVQARRQRLDELRAALWAHASAHAGDFPANDAGLELPEDRWRVVGDSGMHFIYVAGRKADVGSAPVAYEPGIFGRERWVLFANGDIRRLPIEAIHHALEQEAAP
jgi:hypothetical protein